MAANTELELIIQASKEVELVGDIAVGEHVNVTVRDGGKYIGDGLRLRIRHHGTEIARFPVADGDTWAMGGDDAKCVLDMRTLEGFAIFAGRPDICAVKCVLILDCTEDDSYTLNVASPINVQNWPWDEGGVTPLAIPKWNALLQALQGAVNLLQGNFTSHNHDGQNSSQLEHGDLLSIGTKTHAELEQDIDGLDLAVGSLGVRMGSAEGNVVTLGGRMETHNHTGGAQGQKLNHGDLSGVGTQTHPELEGDIQAVGQKADAASLAVTTHDHSGGNEGVVLDITGLSGYADLMNTLGAMTNRIAALETFRDVDVPRDYLPIPSSANYSVTAPSGGEYRNIRDDMTGDQMAACLPTIVKDLQKARVL